MNISKISVPSYSFKGSEGQETLKVKDVSSKVEAVTGELKETSDALAEGTKVVTESVGTLGTSALGLWAIAKKPIVGVYEFFTDVVIDKATGKPVIQDVFDSQGNKKINKETGEAITKVLRKANWKKIGIAGGIVAGTVALLTIAKKIKNDKAEKAQAAEVATATTENENKSEEV